MQWYSKGKIGENSPVCPIRNVLKKLFWLPVRVGLLYNDS